MIPFSKKPDTKNQPGVLLEVFTIRDGKGGFYGAPFFTKLVSDAERIFTRMYNDPSTNIFGFPEDFDLYHLGQFDMDKGVFIAFDTPMHIVKAVNLKKFPAGPTPEM